jgi:hypothetical protein
MTQHSPGTVTMVTPDFMIFNNFIDASRHVSFLTSNWLAISFWTTAFAREPLRCREECLFLTRSTCSYLCRFTDCRAYFSVKLPHVLPLVLLHHSVSLAIPATIHSSIKLSSVYISFVPSMLNASRTPIATAPSGPKSPIPSPAAPGPGRSCTSGVA